MCIRDRFLGTYEPKLDAKSRLILPSKFRNQLENGLVITKGQDRCLYVFPINEFENIYKALKNTSLTSKQARDYSRIMLSGASDEIPDKQGRITITAQLREYANIDKELSVIGVGSRIEIWDRKIWSEYSNAQEEIFSNTEDEIMPGVF